MEFFINDFAGLFCIKLCNAVKIIGVDSVEIISDSVLQKKSERKQQEKQDSADTKTERTRYIAVQKSGLFHFINISHKN